MVTRLEACFSDEKYAIGLFFYGGKMSTVELLLIAIALSMDAFAVAVGYGLSVDKISIKSSLIVGLYFGIAQGVMPVIGYFLGTNFERFITPVDHWIAFVLLAFIGGKMIKESFDKDEESDRTEMSLKFKKMIVLAIATSIDALAMGISFAVLRVNIVTAATSIAIITLALSMVGVKVGNVFGLKYKSIAEFIGGTVIVFIGLKILLNHLGVINF